MPFSGSGTFSRLYSWVTDAANGVKIRADRMDAEDNGFATGLSDCVTRDGQSAATANLPMGGFKHTNVADASATTHYPSVKQIINSAFDTLSVGGTANAITLTSTVAPSALEGGQEVWWIVGANSTSTVTINRDGLGAKNLYLRGAALVSGALVAGDLAGARYDGTQYNLITPIRLIDAALLTSGTIPNGCFPATLPAASGANLTNIPNTAITGLGTLSTANSINNSNWSGTALSVANGGTGLTSLTAHYLLIGNSTSTPTLLAPGTSGLPLLSQGSSADPAYGQIVLTSAVTGVLPVANGGLGVSSFTAHYLAIGNGTSAPTLLAPGTTKYPLLSQGASSDPAYGQLDLTAAVTGALPIANGGTASTTASAARTALGLAIGTNVQAYGANLDAFAALSLIADQLPYANGTGTLALATFTSAGRSLVSGADASAQRTTLGLGTASTQNTGTSGANVPLLNGNNTYSGTSAFTGAATFSAQVNGPAATLTDGATVSWNVSAAQVATLTLGGNRTMAAPTNLVAGGSYALILKQDGTGSRTVTWNSVFKWAGGSAPTLSTAASAVDVLTFVSDGTNLYGAIQKAFA